MPVGRIVGIFLLGGVGFLVVIGVIIGSLTQRKPTREVYSINNLPTPAPTVKPTATVPVKAAVKKQTRQQSSTSKQATIITENANLRKEPNNYGEIVLEIPELTIVTVIKQKGAWFYIEWGGIEGWVHGNTIRLN